MIILLIVIALLYITTMLVMALFQRKLMYFPDKNIGSPEQYGLIGFSEHFIRNTDHFALQIWYRPAATGMPTIVYFHGNASHIGNRAGILSALTNKGFGMLGLSYRGYGKSEGTPSEQGIYTDARAAIHYLIDVQHIPLSHIMIYGESLGTGVTLQMATEFDVSAIALQAPYTSVVGRAAEIYFFIPVKLLIRDRFESLRKIKKIKMPVIFFHGELDTTIPIRHGKVLFAATNTPKEAIYFPDVGHNNFDSAIIANHVLAFAKKHIMKKDGNATN